VQPGSAWQWGDAEALDLHVAELMKDIAGHWWMVVARGIASFAFAGALLLVPDWSSVRALTVLFGIWALADGGGALAFAFAVRGAPVAAYFGRGCLGIAVGALALALPQPPTVMLYVLVSAWAIGTGALEMAFASRAWFVLPRAVGFMLVGLVTLGLGMSLPWFPLESAATLRAFLVVFAVANGVAATIMGEALHLPPRHALPSRAT